MTLEEFDNYLSLNNKKISQRLLSPKVGINSIKIDNIQRTGRHKDLKAEAVQKAFGMTKSCLWGWRRGNGGIQKQFLFKVLMSLPFEVLNKIEELQNENI